MAYGRPHLVKGRDLAAHIAMPPGCVVADIKMPRREWVETVTKGKIIRRAFS
jgi:hypothetical protein